MKSPHITHPNKFCIDGYVFKVVSNHTLSEQQAANAAVKFCKIDQHHKQSKKNIHTVIYTDS